MPENTIRDAVLDAIVSVAPETDPAAIGDDADFIDELDLDSMDGMNIAVGIYERTGVDIAERDYAKLRTIRDLVGYVADATSGSN